MHKLSHIYGECLVSGTYKNIAQINKITPAIMICEKFHPRENKIMILIYI